MVAAFNLYFDTDIPYHIIPNVKKKLEYKFQKIAQR